MRDLSGRNINYMRISITDRCNLRCKYCMPDDIESTPFDRLLTYEEIVYVVEEAVKLGITRYKITGGEPFLRKGCPRLIGMIKNVPGVEQVTLTTNGVLLGNYVDELINVGLDAVNISLDTLKAERYKEITGFDKLDSVLNGLDMAYRAGFNIKINAVLQKGVNDDEIIELANLARDRAIYVRFIELMPIGSGNPDKGIAGADILDKLEAVYPGVTLDASVHGNGPAVYYKVPGFAGGIGFINAMHGKFCGSCNRIRVSAQGYIKPCLCYEEGVDLMETLRDGHYHLVGELIARAIEMKPLEHVFDHVEKISEQSKMVQIGG